MADVGAITLYHYQEIAAEWIAGRLRRRDVTIVSAEMGLGKTHMVTAAIKLVQKQALIVCPKSAIPHWHSVMSRMGIPILAIVNYESIRAGKIYSDDTFSVRIVSPYYQPSTGWRLPRDTVLVFDECHRAKNPTSESGKMLVAAKQAHDQGTPIVLVSATISEIPADAKIILYLLGISALPKQSLAALRSGASHLLRGIPKDQKERVLMAHLGTILEPHTHRVTLDRSEQIAFQNRKSVVFGIVDHADQIEEYYRRIRKELGRPGCSLPKIQKLRQRIELARMILFLEHGQEGLEQGYHLIAFVNYLASAELLLQSWPNAGYIRGGQSVKERSELVASYQRNELPVLICQVAAGGECISLHDTDGRYPRLAMHSCPDTATALTQAMGRAYRAGQASHVVQKLIFLRGVSYEQRGAARIEAKLDNLASLRDDDLP